MKKKLELLCKIANQFNKEKIVWAVGGSMVLYLNKIIDDVHDLDIMIDVKDASKAINILSTMTKHLPKEEIDMFHSTVFEQFEVNDIYVDLIGGFTIIKENCKYQFPIQKELLEEVNIDNSKIYLERVEDWLERYMLMNRMDKVEFIKKLLEK